MTIKVEIDRALCARSGNCFEVCPEVFEPDNEGVSQIKEKYRTVSEAPGRSATSLSSGEVPDDLRRKVQDAVDQCPMVAIEIR